MARVVITANVKNVDAWERAFRSHGELFRSQPAASPYTFSTSGDNEVAVSAEVDDVGAYLESLESAETAAAMENDGVIRDSVKVFVLDKEFRF